jgi:hypothetical protein
MRPTAPAIAGRQITDMTTQRILIRLVVMMPNSMAAMPIPPVGICMRMLVKALKLTQDHDEARVLMLAARPDLLEAEPFGD